MQTKLNKTVSKKPQVNRLCYYFIYCSNTLFALDKQSFLKLLIRKICWLVTVEKL